MMVMMTMTPHARLCPAVDSRPSSPLAQPLLPPGALPASYSEPLSPGPHSHSHHPGEQLRRVASAPVTHLPTMQQHAQAQLRPQTPRSPSPTPSTLFTPSLSINELDANTTIPVRSPHLTLAHPERLTWRDCGVWCCPQGPGLDAGEGGAWVVTPGLVAGLALGDSAVSLVSHTNLSA
jgi:hypothetical protein